MVVFERKDMCLIGAENVSTALSDCVAVAGAQRVRPLEDHFERWRSWAQSRIQQEIAMFACLALAFQGEKASKRGNMPSAL